MKTRGFFTRTFYVVMALSITCLVPARATAWGTRGHQIIARVAMDRLSSNARREVAGLLQPGETLESVSDWADEIKAGRRDTTSWHFVAISVNVSDYNAERDCRRGTCIIQAIENQKSTLQNQKATPEERAEALKFLVHLIGDLHQPFHVTTNDKNPDFGASRVKVKSPYGATNLHSVWDDDMVEYGLRRSGFQLAQYAGELGDKSRKSQSGYVAQGSVIDWALESHRLANQAYKLDSEFMWNFKTWELNEDYFRQNRSAAENQLFLAGVRLAKTLNDIFS